MLTFHLVLLQDHILSIRGKRICGIFTKQSARLISMQLPASKSRHCSFAVSVSYPPPVDHLKYTACPEIL